MNLLRYELKKIFFNKATIIFLLLLTIANILTLYLNEKISIGMNSDIFAIKRIDEKLMDMESEEARFFLKEYQIANEYSLMGPFLNMDSFEKRYPDYDIKIIIKNIDLGLYPSLTGNYFFDSTLLRSKIVELDTVNSYLQYRKEIDKKATMMQSSPIFASSPFSKRNAIKTSNDFSQLPLFDLSFNSSKGVITATRNELTPVFILLSVVFIGFFVYLQDRDNENLSLLKTMKRGRKLLMFSKILSATALCITSVLLLTLSTYLTSYILYGFGDLSMPLQSLYGFQSSIFNMSVANYLVLYILFLLLASLLVMSFVLFLFVLIQDSMLAIISVLVCLGLSLVLYKAIPYASIFNLLKFLNIYSFLDSGKIIGSYLNLNIGNFPVPFVPVFLILSSFSYLLLSSLTIFIFNRQKEKETIQRRKRLGKLKKKSVMTGVFKYEGFKSMIINPSLFILIFFLLFQLFTVRALKPEEMLSTKDYIYMYYMKELEGPISLEKTALLEKAYEDTFKMQKEDSYRRYDQQLEVLTKLIDKDKHLKEMQESIEDEELKAKVSFVYEKAYNSFFTDGRTTTTTSIFALLLVILSLSNLFAQEKSNNTYDVISSTVYGRKRTFWYKMLISLLTTLLTMLIVYLPYIFKFAKESGFGSLNAPVACIEGLEFIDFNLKISQYTIYLTLAKFTGLLLASIFVSFLSNITGQRILTMGISIFALISPAFLSYLGTSSFNNVLFNVYLFGNKLLAKNLSSIIQAISIALISLLLLGLLFIQYNRKKILKEPNTFHRS